MPNVSVYFSDENLKAIDILVAEELHLPTNKRRFRNRSSAIGYMISNFNAEPADLSGVVAELREIHSLIVNGNFTVDGYDGGDDFTSQEEQELALRAVQLFNGIKGS